MEKTGKKGLDLEKAYRVMGRLIMGIDVIDRAFSFIPKRSGQLSPIMCTEKELEIHADLGHRLYFEMPCTNNDGRPLNIETLAKIACKKGNQISPNKYLFWPEQFNNDGSVNPEAWFYANPLVMSATPRFGWKIASEEVIPETLGLDYIDQTDTLIDYSRRIYKNHLPEHYKQAISEWQAKKPILKEILHTDKAAKEIARCKITSLMRKSFVSTEYCRLLIYQTEGRKILQSQWNWSNTRYSDGKFVLVGYFASGGATVSGYEPGNRNGSIGVSFSRSV